MDFIIRNLCRQVTNFVRAFAGSAKILQDLRALRETLETLSIFIACLFCWFAFLEFQESCVKLQLDFV
jgi:hypothetical protein